MMRYYLLLLLLLAWAPVAQAIPAYSRQTGAACNFCHFQDSQSLNANGRAFLRNAFHLTPKLRKRLHALQQKKQQAQNGAKQDARNKH